MVVNPDKFQSIIINGLGKLKNSQEVLIDNHKIKDIGNSLPEGDFYCTKFDFPFNPSCRYSDFMFVSEDK